MRKRGCDDEQLPPLHPPHFHMVPHVPGASNMGGTSNIAGASIIAGASDAVGAGGMLLALALQGTRNMAGTCVSAGADNNLSASGSAGANQPFPTVYPRNPHDNLRMLEIMANMDAFGTPPLPEIALCGSNTIAMWRRRYKQQEDRIQTLTLEMDSLLKETIDKSIIIVDQKVELDCLRSLLNESRTANEAPQQCGCRNRNGS
jgi:hypothetical protein